MENLNNKMAIKQILGWWINMTTERAIHFAIFVLMLVGLCGVSAWASYTFLSETLILEVASIALSWGVILLILYVGFKKLNWDWWS
jgi:hypothetical protein